MFRQEVDSLMQPLSLKEPGQLNSLSPSLLPLDLLLTHLSHVSLSSEQDVLLAGVLQVSTNSHITSP